MQNQEMQKLETDQLYAIDQSFKEQVASFRSAERASQSKDKEEQKGIMKDLFNKAMTRQSSILVSFQQDFQKYVTDYIEERIRTQQEAVEKTNRKWTNQQKEQNQEQFEQIKNLVQRQINGGTPLNADGNSEVQTKFKENMAAFGKNLLDLKSDIEFLQKQISSQSENLNRSLVVE